MYLYFSQREIPSVSPAFSGMWQTTTNASRAVLKPTKTTNAISIGTTINGGAGAGSTYLDRQYVSPGLAFQQVISGRISGQLMTREFATTDNVDRVLLCGKVVSSNGQTTRGVLLASGNYGPTLELISNVTCRNKTIASGQNLNLVTGLAGDRIVFEIGYQNSTAGTTPQAAAKWGTSGPLLPVNETQTTDGVGWIAITPNLIFNQTSFISQNSDN